MIEPIIDSRVIEQLSKLLKSARHIVITCHLSPDGDALGSTFNCSWCKALRRLRLVLPAEAGGQLLAEHLIGLAAFQRGRGLLREPPAAQRARGLDV